MIRCSLSCDGGAFKNREVGLQMVMRNDDGVFMFKFASKEGLEQVLQRGPWMIRKSPIILTKWSSSLSLKRGEVTSVPFYVCGIMESDQFRPCSYASLESELKSKLTMAIPNEEGDGYTKEVIRVEYEWKPPHCGECKFFRHDLLQCPKHVKETVFNDPSKVGTSTTMETSSDGFTEVTRKKNKDLATKGQMGTNSSINKANGPFTSNSFDILNKVDIGDECGVSSFTASEHTPSTWNKDFESDDEVDEVIFPEGNKWDDQFDIRLKVLLPTKLSPLVDDDVGEEEAIEDNTKVVNNNNEEGESIEVDEVVNIKESKNHPIEQVIEHKNINEALGDESWVIAMQEELNQFVANDVWDLVPLPMSQTVIGIKWGFRNKLDINGEIMPQLNQKDYQRTKAYLPRIHRSKAMDEEVRESYRRLESRLFHEGRFVTPSLFEANNMLPTF
ncbi:retrovirus-related pol polyprotein from transposon TNT 1-94 [Tanacetum coccineum]